MISVLYVDDEPDLLEIAKLFLEMSGDIRVGTSPSAQEALESPAILSCDAIVSDYQMPGMDGIAFLKAVRKQLGDIPFILFTGRGREEVAIDAINNGADFYLQKGGDPTAQFAELEHDIRIAVERRNAVNALLESEQRLADIINFLPDATFAIDIKGMVIAWNRAIEEMTGIPSAEMIGKGNYEYALPFYGERRPSLIDLILETEETIGRRNYTITKRERNVLIAETTSAHPRGVPRTLSGKASLLYDKKGGIAGAIESIRDITETRKAEEELRAAYEQITAAEEELHGQYDALSVNEKLLRKSEENFRALTEHSLDGILIMDFTGNLLFTNRAAGLIVEVPDYETMTGRNALEFVAPESRPDVIRDIGKVAQGTDAFLVTYKLITETKREIRVECIGKKIPFGDSTAILVSLRDVTERKHTEDELLLLKDSVDQAYDEVFWLDFEGNILYVNEAACRTTGYSREELCAMKIFELDPDFPPEVWGQSVTELRERKTQIITTRHRRKDGTIIDVEILASSVRQGDREEYSFAFVRDITDRKRAENTLRESEEKFRDLAELLPQMVYELDPDFRITYANRHTLAVFGLTDSDIEHGVNALSFIEPSQHGRLREMEQKQRAGISYEPQEYNAVRKDGSMFPVIIYSAPAYRNKLLSGFRGVVVDISARKKMEDELRESEKKFRRLADNAPAMIFRMSLPDGVYEYVSPASVALTGYTPEEFYSHPSLIRNLIHPAWQDYFREQWDALLEKKVPAVYEYQIIDRAGQNRWFNQRNMLVTGDQGQPVAIEGIVTDITVQKNTEQELRAGERRSLAVTTNAGSWIWEVDPGGIYRYSSPAVEQILGYRPDELVGKVHFYDLFDPSVRDALKTVAIGAFGSREPFRHFVNLNCHRNGTPVLLETSGTPVFDEEGTFSGYCGVDDEITEQKRAEEALRESQQMLAEAMDIANLANWECDLRTGIFTFDDRFYALYGTTAEREGGNQMPADVYTREFIHPEDRSVVAEEVEKARKTTDPDYMSQREHRIIRRDGEMRHIVVRIRVTKDAEGRTIKTHGANQDITERKRSEEALRLANHHLNLLTGITRHDILNKISAVLGYLKIAEKKFNDTALSEYLEKMESNIIAIRSQIEFTRVYQDLGTHEPQWIDLDSVMPRSQVPATITLEADVPGVAVLADPMLERVFFNLLDNSIRHGQRVTGIRVSSRQPGEDLVVVWEDNGIGIASGEKEKIFQWGFGKNTGIGMFLVREILSLTGITIRETGVPGKGVRFEIVIPRGVYRIPAGNPEKTSRHRDSVAGGSAR